METEALIHTVTQPWRQSVGTVATWEAAHHKNNVFVLTTSRGVRLVLKEVHQSPERLTTEYDLLRYLQAAGIPVAVPLLTDNQRSYGVSEGKTYTLSPALPATQVSGEDVSVLYTNTGRAVADLHQALAAYPGAIQSWTMDLPQQLESEVFPLLERELPAQTWERLQQRITTIKSALYDTLAQLPKQRIHGDCHGGNILYEGDQVSGFIDLDHLPIGPRVYDISYYLADQVKNRIASPEQLAVWLSTFTAVIAGYEQKLSLAREEKAAIWYGMLAAQLLFVYWFVKFQNDEHFRKNLDVFDWIYDHQQTIHSSLVTSPAPSLEGG